MCVCVRACVCGCLCVRAYVYVLVQATNMVYIIWKDHLYACAYMECEWTWAYMPFSGLRHESWCVCVCVRVFVVLYVVISVSLCVLVCLPSFRVKVSRCLKHSSGYRIQHFRHERNEGNQRRSQTSGRQEEGKDVQGLILPRVDESLASCHHLHSGQWPPLLSVERHSLAL